MRYLSPLHHPHPHLRLSRLAFHSSTLFRPLQREPISLYRTLPGLALWLLTPFPWIVPSKICSRTHRLLLGSPASGPSHWCSPWQAAWCTSVRTCSSRPSSCRCPFASSPPLSAPPSSASTRCRWSCGSSIWTASSFLGYSSLSAKGSGRYSWRLMLARTRRLPSQTAHPTAGLSPFSSYVLSILYCSECQRYCSATTITSYWGRRRNCFQSFACQTFPFLQIRSRGRLQRRHHLQGCAAWRASWPVGASPWWFGDALLHHTCPSPLTLFGSARRSWPPSFALLLSPCPCWARQLDRL